MSAFLPKRTAELLLPNLETQTPPRRISPMHRECSADSKCQLQDDSFSSTCATIKKHLSTIPKRTTDLPPLESESDSDDEENDNPNGQTVGMKLFAEHSEAVVTPFRSTLVTIQEIKESKDKDHKSSFEEMASEEGRSENNSVHSRHVTQNPAPLTSTKSTVKLTFPQSSFKSLQRPVPISRTKSLTVTSMSTQKPPIQHQNLATLQVVRSFPAPRHPLTARQLFTPDGREILGQSKGLKPTPRIFRGAQSPLFENDDIEDFQNESKSKSDVTSLSYLEDTLLNDEPHYSRIFDVSVAIEKPLPDIDIEEFSQKIKEESISITNLSFKHPSAYKKKVDEISKSRILTSKIDKRVSLEAAPDEMLTPPDTKKLDSNQITLTIEKTRLSTQFFVEGKEYTFCRKIGKGGSAYVFEVSAHNMENLKNETYALKMIHLQNEQSLLDEYKQEIKIMKSLHNNKYIIQYFASQISHSLDNTFAHIVMELGQTDLYQHLMSYKDDIPLFELVTWFHDMIHSLDVIHENRIIHADLKPGNYIMINGHLKLADFGISLCLEPNATYIDKVIVAGTCNFLSPEAVHSVMTSASVRLTCSSDIWSLGIIFYYLIYKNLPFGALKTREEKLKAIVDSKTVIQFPPMPDYYPEMLRKMTINCLQYDPEKRPSANELLKTYPLHKMAPVKCDSTCS